MLAQFISSAIKHFLRAPVITGVNIIGLALGLACFLVAWGMSSYWQQSDSSFEKADRIYILTQQFQTNENVPRVNPFSASPAARYLREDVPELEAVARISDGFDASIAYEGKSIALYGSVADPELFNIFDFDFVYGSQDKALVTRENIIMTQKSAEKLFGDVDPVGRSVTIDGEFHTLVGVIAEIPQPSHLGDKTNSIRRFDFLRKWPEPKEGRLEWWMGTAGITYMLLPENNRELVKTKLDKELAGFVNRRIPADQQKNVEKVWFGKMSLPELQSQILDNRIFQSQSKLLSVKGVLFGMGIVILLVSCINYANLATAQAAGYAKEVGLRKVVGSSRNSIILQYWLEALLLAILSGLVAIIILALCAPILKVHTGINLLDSLRHTQFFLLTFLGLIFIVSFLASLYPVFFLSRIRPVEALRSGNIKNGSGLLKQILVGTQFAIASTLLILVLIVGQQNRFMRDIVLHPDKDPIAVLVDNGSIKMGPAQLREALENEQAIKSVSAINHVPWSGYRNYLTLTRSRAENATAFKSNISAFGYDFISTFQANLIAGRDFNPKIETWGEPTPDTYDPDNPNATSAVIIDNTFRKVLGFDTPEAAIGENLYFAPSIQKSFGQNPTIKIIGVVETVPFSSAADYTRSNFYDLSIWNNENPAIRIDKNKVKEGIAAIEKAVKDRDPDNAVIIRFTDKEFERNFKTYDSISAGFTGLSLIALFISGMGLFAMAVFTSLQRRQEIGIRKTLGASTWEVTSLLIRDFSRPVLIANVLAWPLAWYAGRSYLNGFLQHIELSLIPWILGFIFTLLIAWFAVGAQTYSAARVKPAEVLKGD